MPPFRAADARTRSKSTGAIASRLGASERTIKIHRAQVMRKMQAASLPALVRMAEKLGISHVE